MPVGWMPRTSGPVPGGVRASRSGPDLPGWNSLGRLPQKTAERLGAAVANEWGRDLIRGWNAGWYDAPSRIGDRIGGLIGAWKGRW